MIRTHKFFDKDIESIQLFQGRVELHINCHTEAIVLDEDDVRALAIHFGIIKG